MRNTFFALPIALTLAVGLAAQQPAAPPQADAQQPPLTFKVEINYVEVDAVVTDAEGNFATDLGKDDFTVYEDGKPQTLSVFSHVDIPIERADPPLFASSAIPPDTTSNKPFDGRVWVLLLDDLQTNFMRSGGTKAAAKLFVERYVGANDLVAVVNTGGRTDGAQDFTSNKALVLKAIDSFSGRKARSGTLAAQDDANINRGLPAGTETTASRSASDFERSMQARNTLATIKGVADFLAGIRGRRKAVVLFSEGIDYDVYDFMNTSGTNQFASDVQMATRDAIAAATRANVSIYGVDPRGLGGLGDESIQIQGLPEDNSYGPGSLNNELRLSQDSLRVLSDETGGFATVNRNDFNDAFSRILRDNSSYYVLGYYPANEKHDGRFHKIEVKVSRPGVKVRTRRGYVGTKGKGDTPKRSAGEKTSAPLRDAMDSPIPVSGLPIRLSAAPFKGTEPNASIALTLEFDASQFKFTEQQGVHTDDLEISLVAIDGKAKVKDGGHDIVNLKLGQSYEAVRANGLRVTRRLEVPPGRYRLVAGAREANGGLVGTVLYDLDVPDFTKDDLVMSGIAIASAAGSRTPTASADPAFKDVLPAAPTSRREFVRNDALAVFAEIYDNKPTTAHGVGITLSVLADDGKVVYTTSDQRRSEELQGRPGGYGYTAQIPLTQFAPGRYVLRIAATSTLAGTPAVQRDVEFRVQ
jgi:VWFA-related protein